ncbi:MAG: hypothetical protein K8U03_22245 [Planctomycetia bacterium]|nr:hypothetical protein [Planctomycetia bacterium]
MKKLLFSVFLLLATTSVALATTADQATVSGALDALEFEFIKPRDGTIGGPQEYKATQGTIAALRRTQFWVKSDGSITFTKPPGVGAGGVAATKEQSLIGDALQKLKFKYVQPTNGKVGGDQEYEVTHETIRHLRGSRFWLLGDGSISFKPPTE